MNKMNATDGKYVILHDWMNQLGLSANEKIALALVYGFAMKEGCSCVKNACVQEWVGCTKKTAINIMDSLEEKGLIIRVQEIINGKIANTYKLGEEKLLSMGVKITPQGCKNYTVWVKKLHPKGEKITPYKDINKDNIIKEVVVEENACAKIFEMLTDNEEGLEIMLMRNKLISAKTSLQEMKEIVKPYAEEYYKQQLMSGGEHFDRRGRSDVKTHFMRWLPKHLEIKKDQEEIRTQPIATKQNGTNQQDLIAELRKRRRAKESGQQ